MSNDRWFKQLETDGMLVQDVGAPGWVFLPSTGGYFDEHALRQLADELERRNKPFWDEYEAYCIAQEARYSDSTLEEVFSFEPAPVPE